MYRGTSLIRKQPRPLEPPLDPRYSPTVGSKEGGVSYERGAPNGFRVLNPPIRRFRVQGADRIKGWDASANLVRQFGTVLDSRTTATQKCEAVPRRARI